MKRFAFAIHHFTGFIAPNINHPLDKNGDEKNPWSFGIIKFSFLNAMQRTCP